MTGITNSPNATSYSASNWLGVMTSASGRTTSRYTSKTSAGTYCWEDRGRMIKRVFVVVRVNCFFPTILPKSPITGSQTANTESSTFKLPQKLLQILWEENKILKLLIFCRKFERLGLKFVKNFVTHFIWVFLFSSALIHNKPFVVSIKNRDNSSSLDFRILTKNTENFSFMIFLGPAEHNLEKDRDKKIWWKDPPQIFY